MVYTVKKNKSVFDLFTAAGPTTGMYVGSAEQLQLSPATVLGPRAQGCAQGEVRAVWGLTLEDDARLTAEMVLSLGINRAFRTLSFARFARWSDKEAGPAGPYLVEAGGAMLSRTVRILHLMDDGASYSL